MNTSEFTQEQQRAVFVKWFNATCQTLKDKIQSDDCYTASMKIEILDADDDQYEYELHLTATKKVSHE